MVQEAQSMKELQMVLVVMVMMMVVMDLLTE
jgi:hypothetical protein